MAMHDIMRCFRRNYLSMSGMEIRQSDIYGDAGRLPYNSVLYLDIIAMNPGCTITKMSEMLGVTKATVTMTVNRLVDKGMVVRERTPEDGRVRKLFLSERMREAYDRTDGIISELADTLSDMHTPEEVDLFCRMMDEASELMDSWKRED